MKSINEWSQQWIEQEGTTLRALLSDVRTEALLAATAACETEHLESHGSPDQVEEDQAYDRGIRDGANAIRRLMGLESQPVAPVSTKMRLIDAVLPPDQPIKKAVSRRAKPR